MMETSNTAPKRGVPLWAQIVIWAILGSLLVLLAITLGKRQQGTVQPGEQIPDFTLTLYSGYEFEGRSEVKLSDLKGRVVVLNFWASWCKPCEQEAAELEQAWRNYEPSGSVVFLGADYVDTEPEARIYMQKFDITYPTGPDLATRISQLFRIQGVPETYFIDKQGVLQYVKIGPFSSVEEITGQIDTLLARE